MKKNPGRKDGRLDVRKTVRQKGDLNRKSTHKMRTHDGMVGGDNPKFKRTPQGIVRI